MTRFVSYPGAAEYISTSVDSIKRMVKDGKLTAHKVGPKTVRIDLEELDQLVFNKADNSKSKAG